MTRELTIGTRSSRLALWQARRVRSQLENAGHRVAIQEITTKGDRILDQPLADIGDKGLFTKELDVALLNGEIDVAVHSLKDLPTQLPPGICLAAIGERADPGDALITHPKVNGLLADLPEGSTLATSSLRRKAQLLAWRPDLNVVPVRGNVPTRIQKLDESSWEGIVLAVAGLQRLELTNRIAEKISYDVVLPAVGQGALGILCREDDGRTLDIVRDAVHDEDAAAAVLAERALLRRLEGGCQVPIGAYATVQGHSLSMVACVASLDGSRIIRERIDGVTEAARALGVSLAETLLSRGANAILDEIRRQEP